jgi:hypothetical protein
MGNYARENRPQILPMLADSEISAGRRPQLDDDAHLSEQASGALGPTLNQRPHVQRLTRLGRSMNSGPSAGGKPIQG